MISQISIALRGHQKASSLIFKRKYAKYLLFPLLLNVIIIWAGIDFVSDAAASLQQYLMEIFNLEKGDFWGAKYLAMGLKGLTQTLIYVLFFLLFVFFSGYIIVIILSPIFSAISEKTEKEVNPDFKKVPFNTKQFLKDIFRGIRIALRNMTIESFIMILVLIIGFIPIVGWIAPIFMFFVSAYFFGFSFMDYTMERMQLSVKQSVKLMRKYKWTAITNGAFFSFFLLIPYCGVAISAFVAVWSVIAGTLSVFEINRKEKNQI